MREDLKKDVKRVIRIIFASLIIAANIKIFVNAGSLFPGGFTGLSILIQRSFDKFLGIKIPYSPVNIILNAIPAWFCFKAIGKKFTGLSCLCIVLTSIFTDIIPALPITYDVLLISIFGGIVMGAGISICLSAEATSGGTDFIAMYISQKYGKDAFSYIFAGNMVLLAIAGFLFGWDAALYSIIFQFSSTQVIHMLNKRYQKNTLLIVTSKPEEVEDAIYTITHHGATRIEAKGAYTNIERPLVYSIVSSENVKKVMTAIRKIDEDAFVNVIKTDDVEGNFYIPPMD